MANERSFISRAATNPRAAYRFGRMRASSLYRSTLGASGPGRQFAQGIGETFGIHYEKGISKGFLGRKAAGGILAGGAGGVIGRALFPAFTAYGMYQGYKQGGILGAAKSGIEDAAMWGATRAAWTMATNPFVLGAAAVVGAGYGAYRLGLAAKERSLKMRNLEMGADVVDMFGTLNTMRNRSLSAIQNSHLNGRSSLGNEALLLSSHYRR